MRRRPSRSPSAAPVSSSTAKLSVYAFTVHSSAASDACRCTLITGSAVATTWVSSDTMKDATDVSASTQPCPGVRRLPSVPTFPPRCDVPSGYRHRAARQLTDDFPAAAGVSTDVTTDTALERARAGDDQAFGELTGPYLAELRLHCYRILGSVQDAEDVLQETLLAAWRGLGQYEGRAVAAHLAVPDRDQPLPERAARQRPPPPAGAARAAVRGARADPAR